METVVEEEDMKVLLWQINRSIDGIDRCGEVRVYLGVTFKIIDIKRISGFNDRW